MRYVSGSRGKAASLTLMLWLGLALASTGCKLRLVGSSGGTESGARTETDISAPTVSSISNQDLAPGSSTGPVTISVADSDTEAENLTVTAHSDNQTLLPDSAIVITGTGASRSISATPVAGQTGTATVTVTVSDGVHTTTETFVVTVTGLNLEVPIEVGDYGAYMGGAPGSAATWEHTRVSLDTSDYDGTVTYFFEIVAENWLMAAGAEVYLVDSSGATRATIALSTSSNQRIRYRGTFTPNVGADTYRVRTTQTADLLVDEARILVRQQGATRTRLYFPIYNAHDGTYDELGQPTVAKSTTSSTYSTLDPLFHPDWLKDSSALSAVAAGSAWTLEAVMSTDNPAATADLSLFKGGTTLVAASTVSTNAAVPTLVSTSFADGAANFDNGSQFNVKLRSSNGVATARLYRAGLWVRLTNLSKAQILYRYQRAKWAASTQVAFMQRVLIDTTVFSTPTFYHECHGLEAGMADDTTMELRTDGVNDSGVGPGSLILGSGIQFDSTTHIRKRSSAISLTSGDRYIFRGLRNSGTWDLTVCFIVVNATR